jgi:hypothetical protein
MPGYPTPIGVKIETIVDRDGPANYTGGTSGTDILNASDVGLGGMELVQADALSQDGLTSAVATLINQSTTSDFMANAVPTARIRYFVIATGVEVANAQNLSSKSFRFQIRGV